MGPLQIQLPFFWPIFTTKISVYEGLKPFKCNIYSNSFAEKSLLLSSILSEHEKSPHDDALPTCSKCHTLAIHVFKTYEENLCKFDII